MGDRLGDVLKYPTLEKIITTDMKIFVRRSDGIKGMRKARWLGPYKVLLVDKENVVYEGHSD
jgi:hypothetical protein